MRPRSRRPRTVLACEGLESRACLVPFVGPLPDSPLSVRPTPETRPDLLALDVLLARQAAAATPNVAFYGDSITYNFAFYHGSDVWGRSIAPLGALDFGVPTDTTQNLLWRIEHGGELVGFPKVAVVEIGTNNLIGDRESPAETYEGIMAVASAIHAMSPPTKVVILGMLPYGAPDNPFRVEIAAVNAALRVTVDYTTTYFVDIGPRLMDANGSIAANFEPDLGHPDARGYQIWADTLSGPLRQWMGLMPGPSPAPFVGPIPH